MEKDLFRSISEQLPYKRPWSVLINQFDTETFCLSFRLTGSLRFNFFEVRYITLVTWLSKNQVQANMNLEIYDIKL